MFLREQAAPASETRREKAATVPRRRQPVRRHRLLFQACLFQHR
jgi:hypothetical protein